MPADAHIFNTLTVIKFIITFSQSANTKSTFVKYFNFNQINQFHKISHKHPRRRFGVLLKQAENPAGLDQAKPLLEGVQLAEYFKSRRGDQEYSLLRRPAINALPATYYV